MIRDQELLEAYTKARDAQAFAELAGRYAPIVYATCLRVTRNRADAEDAAQETLLQLARTPGAIQSNVGGWLYRTARNKAAAQVRSTARRREHENAAAAPPPAIDQRVQDVDDVVSTLGDDLRQPVILRFMRGLTLDEVAEELQVSQPTVSRRIGRALELLRSKMEPAGAAAVLGGAAFAGDPVVGAQISQQVTAVVTSVNTAAAAGGVVSGLTVAKVAVAAVVVGGAIIGGSQLFGVGKTPAAPAPTVAAAPPATAPVAAWQVDGNKVTIAGVGSAELIGLYSDETDPPTWWAPDGGPLTMPFTKSSIGPTSFWQDQLRLRFVVQLSGQAVALPYFWEFQDAQGSRWTGRPPTDRFLPRLDLKEAEAAYWPGTKTASIKYGLAAAKPERLLEAEVKGDAMAGSKDVWIVDVRPDDRGMVVKYSVDIAVDAERVIGAFVVDAGGRWVSHNNSNRNPHDGQVDYEQFFPVPLDEASKIVVQGQRFTHWITWNNVSLEPGKSEVTVSVKAIEP